MMEMMEKERLDKAHVEGQLKKQHLVLAAVVVLLLGQEHFLCAKLEAVALQVCKTVCGKLV